FSRDRQAHLPLRLHTRQVDRLAGSLYVFTVFQVTSCVTWAEEFIRMRRVPSPVHRTTQMLTDRGKRDDFIAFFIDPSRVGYVGLVPSILSILDREVDTNRLLRKIGRLMLCRDEITAAR